MNKKHQVLFIFLFPVLLLVIGFIADRPSDLMYGMGKILVSPSILLHDYLTIGGLGATFVNAGICGIICCLMIIHQKIEINGPFIAAVFTVIGFSFFGKNFLNIWPIFIGVKLYALTQKVPFRNYALVALFGTTLAPLGSAIAFGSWLAGWPAFGVAVLFGTAAGFVLPPLASHMLRFHDGYNIYNIGFTGGIIGSFLTALLRSFDFTITASTQLSGQFTAVITVLLVSFFAFLMVLGFAADYRGERMLSEGLKKIFASSGRLVSDFTSIGGYPSTFFNMGMMGIISVVFVLALGGELNGPVVGGILTVVGFAAFGKHPKNTLPILAGVVIASSLKIWSGNSTGVIIAGLFSTTLAPTAGQYGMFVGVLAGFFHLSIVMNVGVLHGGVNLYNNGFAGGFVASFLVPVIDALKKRRSHES